PRPGRAFGAPERAAQTMKRRGVSLLEVLVAVVIFLLAFGALSDLVSSSSRRAAEVQMRGEAAMRCQSKLSEVASGAVPLSSQEDVPFDEDSNWHWSLDASQGEVAGVWNVQVRVSRQQSDGSKVEVALGQMVLDPSIRGSSMDTVASTGMDTGDTGGGGSATGATGGSSTPAGGGAT